MTLQPVILSEAKNLNLFITVNELMPKSVDRNYAAAIFFTIGILHELEDVLNAMISKLSKELSKKKAIDIKNTLFKNQQRPLLRNYRKFISAHLSKELPEIDVDQISPIKLPLITYDFGKQGDVYYAFADDVLNRAFIKKYCGCDVLKKDTTDYDFESIYSKKLGLFLDYVQKIHRTILEQGDELLACILEEYQLSTQINE